MGKGHPQTEHKVSQVSGVDPTEHWAIMGASEGHEATPRQSALAALAPSVPHLRLLRRSLSLSRLGRKRDW